MSSFVEFEAHYATQSDDELMWIATNKASSLLPEAMAALRSELQRRGLLTSAERAIDAQSRMWTQAEMLRFVDEFRSRPCPHCGRLGVPINAVTTAIARSVVIFSSYKPEVVIGCPNCLISKAQHATWISLAFGWWGLPFGPTFTFRALFANDKAQGAAAKPEASPELYDYVRTNRGEIASGLS